MIIEELKSVRIRPLGSVKPSEWLKAGLWIVSSGFVLWAGLFVVPVMSVKDVSMLPSVTPGSLVWIWPTTRWLLPQKGEVVITGLPTSVVSHLKKSPKYRAKFKDHPPEMVLLKRVQGVPGDRVKWQGKTITLGSDQYWVEGDNKRKSVDSRASFFGPVPASDILGRAYLLWKSGDNSHG
ncbi:MAG: S26 family signal peptidase [Gemmatimonadaceae bacterium]|nr:S26 family signal peptidase [Gloeobacterales cyanobacterium ES-bin-141]